MPGLSSFLELLARLGPVRSLDRVVLHPRGYDLTCTRFMCFIALDFSENLEIHPSTGQWYDARDVCFLKWVLRVKGCVNCLWHNTHSYILLIRQVLQCVWWVSFGFFFGLMLHWVLLNNLFLDLRYLNLDALGWWWGRVRVDTFLLSYKWQEGWQPISLWVLGMLVWTVGRDHK